MQRMLAFMLTYAVLTLTMPVTAAEPIGGPRLDEEDEHARRLHTMLSLFEEFGFSGAALLARGDSVVLAQGYGEAERESARPVTVETLFDIGELSETFTSTAALRLAMRGGLDIDASIAAYLDNVPNDKSSITPRHLMNHTAGIAPKIDLIGVNLVRRDDVMEAILSKPLMAQPGEQFNPTTFGTAMLAAIIERAAEEPFDGVLMQEVLQAANLPSATIAGRAANDRTKIAHGYERGAPFGSAQVYPRNWQDKGARSVLASVDDLWAWDRALRGDEFLSSEARATLVAAGSQRYASGWHFSEDAHGNRRMHRGGRTFGFLALFERRPEIDTTIIVLANSPEWSFISDHIAETLSGDESALMLEHVQFDRQQQVRLAGTYRLDEANTVTITTDPAGRFMVHPDGPHARQRVLYGSATPDAAAREPLRRSLTATFDALQQEGRQPFVSRIAPDGIWRDVVDSQRTWDTLARANGALVSFAVLGVTGERTVSPPGRTRAVVQAMFERGEALLLVELRDEWVYAVLPLDESERAAQPFVPIAKDQLLRVDPLTGLQVLIQFNTDEADHVTSAHIASLGDDAQSSRPWRREE